MSAESLRTTVRYLHSRYRDGRETATIGSRETRRGVTEPHEVTIHDARPLASSGALELDHQGFVIRDFPAVELNVRDRDEVRASYYPRIEGLIAELAGADHAVAYEHIVRDGSSGSFDSAYARFLHCDYSMGRRHEQGREYFPLNGVTLEPERNWEFAFYNSWQPLGRVVEQNPLTLVDGASVREEDLHDFVYTGRGGEFRSTMPGFNPEHRFYYFPRMRPDEILVFKQLETRSGRVLAAPHTSFHDPTAPDDAPARHSIETRVLCAFAS
jgi:hypothetical protein